MFGYRGVPGGCMFLFPGILFLYLSGSLSHPPSPLHQKKKKNSQPGNLAGTHSYTITLCGKKKCGGNGTFGWEISWSLEGGKEGRKKESKKGRGNREQL